MTVQFKFAEGCEIATLARRARRGLLKIEHVADLALLCFFAGKGLDGRSRPNAVLLEGLNGLSKTEMTKQLNRELCGPALRGFYRLFRLDPLVRVQCTPDQSREDVVGSDVIGADRQMEFRDGPLLRIGD